MNKHLQSVWSFILQDENLSDTERTALTKSLKNADKELELVTFKLDRTEKVKRTTAILLEETIGELEQKRKSVEAQNRELEIEAALERVRSIAMSMHKPEEMVDVCRLISIQLEILGIKEVRNVQTAIIFEHKGNYLNYEYYPKHDKGLATEVLYTDHPMSLAFVQQMLKGGGEIFTKSLDEKEIRDWYTHQQTTNQFKDTYLENASSLCYYWCSLGPVALGLSTYTPFSEDLKALFIRFRNVFELAYRRFLDIQKAIEQVKETQIQLALERVRARTMAMQKSDELAETVFILFQQFQQLGETPDQATIGIINEEERVIEYWVTMYGNQSNRVYKFSIDEPNVTQKIYQAWKEQKKSLVIDLDGKELYDFANYRQSMGGAAFNPEEKRRVINVAFFSKGIINVQSNESRKQESIGLLERFAGVFEQTYTRFLDLQKAEAQASEAQIELSLERVRAKTMAMHNSEEVGDTVATLFDELLKLGIKTNRCGILIFNKPMSAEVWTAKSNPNQKASLIIGQLDLTVHPLLQGIYLAWKSKEAIFTYSMVGDDLLSYYQAINNTKYYPTSFDLNALPVKEFHSDFYFSEGSIFAFTNEPVVVDATAIFNRFAAVFGQTYRRYLDLRRAEEQARESRIETALERVRSRTLAMQRSEELAETAAVLFRQLILLGIEPNRLYIGVIKDDNGHIEFWVTDEEGTKVSTQFTGDIHRNKSLKKMYSAWKQERRSLTIDMKGKELESYIHYLSDELKVPFKQGLSQKRRIQSIAIFAKGFIGIASSEEQPMDTIHLLERFAAVFNLTYTRFNDLKIAEAHAVQAKEDLIKLQTEKNRAEDALTELRATQTQLIQSEKMASLGELTAGIAHEIQNPLNFVNNFSEVSNELIDEMNAEIDKGDLKEAKLIANDIKQNLEKINHHGKRADAIVKGMLQHSRASSATKELTNINKLADEYLRLAFHGLRAKDKTFNATLVTEYDETIGNITIIPQDIGRVILNLITNAFYAVAEMKKAIRAQEGDRPYEPTVSVSTRKIAAKVEIKVEDNGNGVPKNILDKIFQPFFTTKPTGQGTGLGLSLSYDIVKAHGGEIVVETKQGMGSSFCIHLPAA